jgi:hypothetical protein
MSRTLVMIHLACVATFHHALAAGCACHALAAMPWLPAAHAGCACHALAAGCACRLLTQDVLDLVGAGARAEGHEVRDHAVGQAVQQLVVDGQRLPCGRPPREEGGRAAGGRGL